ncbi:hypothetical protein B0H13DRAFT_2539465, partial [Mycena leptocephala]
MWMLNGAIAPQTILGPPRELLSWLPASIAIFSQSHHFTVAGGTFNNITKNYTSAPAVPSDFRMIPMGDIELLEEIRVDNETDVVGYHHPERRRVRRVYSAKIDGRKSGVTVAMYQGDGAEEEWRRDIANYMTVRHPNIIQMCGAASSGGIHATLFHDDLIPFERFLDRHSPLLKVYIYGYCIKDFWATRDYFLTVFQQCLWEDKFTFWIRRSSGQLNSMYWWTGATAIYGRQEIKSLDGPNEEAIAINSLTLEQYHNICYWSLSRTRNFDCSSSATVNLNTIIVCTAGDQLEDSVEIALLPDTKVYRGDWETAAEVAGEVMDGGWTRCASGDIFDSTLKVDIWDW